MNDKSRVWTENIKKYVVVSDLTKIRDVRDDFLNQMGLISCFYTYLPCFYMSGLGDKLETY